MNRSALTQKQCDSRNGPNQEHGAPLRGRQHHVDGQGAQDAHADEQLVQGAQGASEGGRGHLGGGGQGRGTSARGEDRLWMDGEAEMQGAYAEGKRAATRAGASRKEIEPISPSSYPVQLLVAQANLSGQ